MLKQINKNRGRVLEVASLSFCAIILYATSRYNYLLFHGFAEIFSVVIASAVFMIAWNSRKISENNELTYLGIAYLFIGLLDFLHTLSYKGMAIFTEYEYHANQLWIAARYLESISLLVIFAIPKLNKRKPKYSIVLSVYLVVTSLLILSVFVWKIFPVCFVEGKGLTPFKIISEYIISAILLLSLVVIYKKKYTFDQKVIKLIIVSIIFTIISELAFTFYISNYGFSNLVGHYLKLFSFYLIYKAIIETGLNKPMSVIFSKLKNKEQIILADLERKKYVLIRAQKFQERLNTNTSPVIKEADIRCLYMPSEELGGDLINAVSLAQNRIAIILGDCSGHGIEAAMDATLLKSLCDRNLWLLEDLNSPNGFLENLNQDMLAYSNEGEYPTMFVCVIDFRLLKIHYANANGILPFIVNTSTVYQLPHVSGFHLGWSKTTTYEKNVVSFNPNDTLIITSDALLEENYHQHKLFNGRPIKEVLKSFFSGAGSLSENISLFINTLEETSATLPLKDDLSMVFVSPKPPISYQIEILNEENIAPAKTELSTICHSYGYDEAEIYSVTKSFEELIKNALLNITSSIDKVTIRINIDYAKCVCTLASALLDKDTLNTSKEQAKDIQYKEDSTKTSCEKERQAPKTILKYYNR